ncbi:MAG: hypothetical protein ABIF71_13550 [Planctomycetota bacterium]
MNTATLTGAGPADAVPAVTAGVPPQEGRSMCIAWKRTPGAAPAVFMCQVSAGGRPSLKVGDAAGQTAAPADARVCRAPARLAARVIDA